MVIPVKIDIEPDRKPMPAQGLGMPVMLCYKTLRLVELERARFKSDLHYRSPSIAASRTATYSASQKKLATSETISTSRIFSKNVIFISYEVMDHGPRSTDSVGRLAGKGRENHQAPRRGRSRLQAAPGRAASEPTATPRLADPTTWWRRGDGVKSIAIVQ